MRTLTFRQRRLLRKVDHQLRASAEAGAESADGELNIVPFLDVVVNLIMFLLMTVTATLALAQVPSEVPETRAPCSTRCTTAARSGHGKTRSMRCLPSAQRGCWCAPATSWVARCRCWGSDAEVS